MKELSARTLIGVQNTVELIEYPTRREYSDARLVLIEWMSSPGKVQIEHYWHWRHRIIAVECTNYIAIVVAIGADFSD